jgi:hypothetical protein
MTCILINFAMQLTCAFGNKLACTDNETLAQLLYVPSCQAPMLDATPIEPALPEAPHTTQRYRANQTLKPLMR